MNRLLFVVGACLSLAVMFNIFILAVIANVYQDSGIAYDLRAFGDFLEEHKLAGEYFMGSLYIGLHWFFSGVWRWKKAREIIFKQKESIFEEYLRIGGSGKISLD